jgi:hypothetical protein
MAMRGPGLEEKDLLAGKNRLQIFFFILPATRAKLVLSGETVHGMPELHMPRRNQQPLLEEGGLKSRPEHH